MTVAVWSRLKASLSFSARRRKDSARAGVERQAAERLDRRSVVAFPLDPALIAGGKAAVVERAMKGRRESQAFEDLRQGGRQSEPPPAEDRRPLSEVFSYRRPALGKDSGGWPPAPAAATAFRRTRRRSASRARRPTPA